MSQDRVAILLSSPSVCSKTAVDACVVVCRVEHTQASVRALLPRLHYFQEGTCIVHHIFGGRVTEIVAAAYSDAYLTAHFEVCCLCLKLKSCQEQAAGKVETWLLHLGVLPTLLGQHRTCAASR